MIRSYIEEDFDIRDESNFAEQSAEKILVDAKVQVSDVPKFTQVRYKANSEYLQRLRWLIIVVTVKSFVLCGLEVVAWTVRASHGTETVPIRIVYHDVMRLVKIHYADIGLNL